MASEKYAPIIARRKLRDHLPHPSGDVKTCERCGKTMIRKVRHIPWLWNKMRFCSRECGHPVEMKVDIARFESLSIPEPNSGCWLWLGRVMKQETGHPRAYIWKDKKHRIAARVAWELYFGPIHDGLHVCHKCDNPLCVNPGHLFLGTHRDNMADMMKKGRLTPMLGERHPAAQLTESDVLRIRSMDGSAKDVAHIFGVSKSTVAAIRTGQNWGWLK